MSATKMSVKLMMVSLSSIYSIYCETIALLEILASTALPSNRFLALQLSMSLVFSNNVSNLVNTLFNLDRGCPV
jgi:hypothetical protein